MDIIDNKYRKILRSPEYNFVFHKRSGGFYRWGKTMQDDPDFSPYGTEILDIEISSGECSGNCPFCYKKNGSGVPTENMSLETFKEVFEQFPQTLTQIAFGITDIDTNPDFFPIMDYSRQNGVIPNYTTNGNQVTDEVAEKTAKLCGAVAVSLYDKDTCYNAVEKFVNAGMDQVNIHYMLSDETKDGVYELFDDIEKDPRLKGLRAVVMLKYKPHGRGIGRYTSLNPEDYQDIILYAERFNIGIGFDSCSAPMYFKAVEDDLLYKEKTTFAEPCESGLFSFYMNVRGEYFPCSFSEGEPGWEKGLPYQSFVNTEFGVWFHPRVVEWRNKLISSSQGCDCKSASICRSCPLYAEVTPCKDFITFFKNYPSGHYELPVIHDGGFLPSFSYIDESKEKK